MKKFLFYVQHLLGIGHLRRASLICEALVERGHDVVLVQGGHPVDVFRPRAVDIHQLPPLGIGNEGFSDLRTEDGSSPTDSWLNARKDKLLEILDISRPDCVITEAFPFGRRQMRFELLPLIEKVAAAQHKIFLVSSIRDILQEQTKADRIRDILDLLNSRYDLVLVHGDERFIPLEDSFPKASEIRAPVAYTGLVAPAKDTVSQTAREPLVVVSAGGGAVGRKLLETALATSNEDFSPDLNWLFLTGNNVKGEFFDRLKSFESTKFQVKKFDPEFTDLLARATLSISQCGYNTCIDILQSGIRSIVVPFAAGGETEQTRRADILQTRGRACMIAEVNLDPATLTRAMRKLLQEKAPSPPDIDLKGAGNTARILEELLD